MGVSPLPTGPGADLPPNRQAEYEDAVRAAGRHIGEQFLQEGDVMSAWAYFRMIGDPGPVRAALERQEPKEDEEIQALVQIAYHEGVHPLKGFDWILKHFGLCSAITTLSSRELPADAAVRQYCLGRLVHALYTELRERLIFAIEHAEGSPPPEAAVPASEPGMVRRLCVGRDWLFDDDGYHVDTSHLSSVVQMSVHLTPGVEMDLAREMCDYGARLSKSLIGHGDPPFEDVYPSHGTYLAILAGDHVEENLNYFRDRAANADPEIVGTFPAEVLVNLLLQLKREREALEVGLKYLAGVGPRRLTCPSVADLCQRRPAIIELAQYGNSARVWCISWRGCWRRRSSGAALRREFDSHCRPECPSVEG